MSKYKPKIFMLVLAEQHPKSSEYCITYKVSIGFENGKIAQKIQTMYDGKLNLKEDLTFYTGINNEGKKKSLNNQLNSIVKALNEVINNFFSLNEVVREKMNETNITDNKLMREIEQKIKKNKKRLPRFRIINLINDYSSKPLSMRRAVLESIKQFVLIKNVSAEQLKQMFNDDEIPTKSLNVILTVPEFNEWRYQKSDRDPRYFIDELDIIKTSTEDCLVCTQWTEQTFRKYMLMFNEKNEHLKIKEFI